MYQRVEKVKTEVEKMTRFFTEQITIRGTDDSISAGKGTVDFFSRGQLETGEFVEIIDASKSVSLLKVVSGNVDYSFAGDPKTISGAELLTALKAVYEKALVGHYDETPAVQ